MTGQSPALLRCDLCRAVLSTAEATEMVRHGVPCGVCGGRLTLRPKHTRASAADDGGPRPSAERRLLDVLREADPRPVEPRKLAAAGIEDPGNVIFELEQAGYRIERVYAARDAERRFLGYRLRGGA